MHLHSVALRGIGPFPGEHRIDIDALSGAGLFLLEGPTGAGKSTLIDAITFALYGTVASETASKGRLRSAYAPPEVESYVDLVFETQAGIYRIRRTPEYLRPKLRGAGLTRENASAKLWRLAEVPPVAAGGELPGAAGAGGELLSNRLDEVGEQIARIVGLSREQFTQTIVLPQGEFARFLRAKPEDRSVLLERVFGTQLYRGVREQLAEAGRVAARDVAGRRDRARGAVELFVGAAGLDGGEAEPLRQAALVDSALAGGADESGSVRALAAEQVKALASEWDAQGRAADRAEEERDAARVRRDEAVEIRDLAVRRTALIARRSELAAQRPQVEDGRARLRMAARAEVVAPAVAAQRAARAALDEALAREARSAAVLSTRHATATVDALDAERSAVATAHVRWQRLGQLAGGLAERERAVAQGRARLGRDREERSRLAVELASRPAERSHLVAARQDAAGRAGRLDLETDRLAAAQRVRDAAQDLAGLEAAVETATAGLLEATEHAVAAAGAEKRLRDLRIAGIAGELAAELSPGAPCPVCGSTRHPFPAAAGPDAVAPEDVTAAEEARAVAELRQAEAGTALGVAKEHLVAGRAAVQGLTVAQADAALAEARARVAEARAAVDQLSELTERIVAFDEETARAQERVRELAGSIGSAEARWATEASTLAVDREEIATEVSAARRLLGVAGGSDEAESGLDAGAVDCALSARVAALDELLAARSHRATAEAALAQRAEELAARLAEGGFADRDEALAAALTDAQRDALEADIDRHKAQWAAVRAELADPRLAGLPEGLEPDSLAADVVVAQGEATRAEQAATEAVAASRSTAERMERAEAAQTELCGELDAWAVAREAAEPAVRMAAIAAGTSADNTTSMSLETFVLASRFEDVVAAANDRLRHMSSGRYELERSDEREEGRARRLGLALRVIDHRTDAPRGPGTLSGGETFYVSLCLALGLADVVTAEAGGIELGTLFVDEGFGSLDPEALDAVVAELTRLRDNGRQVGVVSHVEALKQSIAERIEVRPLPGGGSTLRVRA